MKILEGKFDYGKKIITCTAFLGVITVFSTTVFTAGNDTPNAYGTNTIIESPVYLDHSVIDVELPGDLNFAINPFSLDVDGDGTADAQIISGEYLITNNSNVPVLVEATTTLTGGDKVDILPDAVYDEKTKDLKASANGKKSNLDGSAAPYGTCKFIRERRVSYCHPSETNG